MSIIILGLLVSVASETCSASHVRVVFLIDSSGSVVYKAGAFERQIRVANAVLETVRTSFAEQEGGKLQWGAVEFGTNANIANDMHVDGGTADTIDENMQTDCHKKGPCGKTSFTAGFNKSVEMLLTDLDENTKIFIWFLTDGMPTDGDFKYRHDRSHLPDIARFREENLDKHGIQTVCAYLTPEDSTLKKANITLRAFCDDKVLLAAHGNSFNLTRYTAMAEEMFRDTVTTAAFVCEPAVWVTAAIVAAAIIASICCCCVGVKAKQYLEEEGEHMTQVLAPPPAQESLSRKRVGSRKRTDEYAKRQNRKH